MRAYILISLLAPGSVLGQVTPAPRSGDPTQYLVTKTTDTADGTCDADCSLREAIIAANVHPGFDEIIIPAADSPYTITIAGTGEDAAADGDLDITEHLVIRGAGPENTIIAGDSVERVFHMPLGTLADEVAISNLTIRNGGNESGGSAVAQSTAGSLLTVNDVIIEENGGSAFRVPIGRTFVCIRCTGRGNGSSVEVIQGAVKLSNSTFSGDDSFELDAGNSASLDLAHVTVVGEVDVNQGMTSWHNVVISGECTLTPGAISSTGGNVESPGDTCSLDPTIDMASVDPAVLGLGPLADNGGRTPTHAIPWNSIAAGFGADDCLPTDQRLAARPTSGCAAGAFEPPIFADGFESGDTTAWSLTVP